MTAYPENFIPIVDAFEKAVSNLEPSARGDAIGEDLSRVEEGKSDRIYLTIDVAEQRVERLFRDALADGLLDAWVEGPNGNMWKLDDREAWRPAAFGIPGFEQKTHHLTNPGPNDEAVRARPRRAGRRPRHDHLGRRAVFPV